MYIYFTADRVSGDAVKPQMLWGNYKFKTYMYLTAIRQCQALRYFLIDSPVSPWKFTFLVVAHLGIPQT